jgi:hypothetical protein
MPSDFEVRALHDRMILELLHVHGKIHPSDPRTSLLEAAWQRIRRDGLAEVFGVRRKRARLTPAGRQAVAYLHRVNAWPSEEEYAILAESGHGRMPASHPVTSTEAWNRLIRLGMFERTAGYQCLLTPAGAKEMERLFPNDDFWRPRQSAEDLDDWQ